MNDHNDRLIGAMENLILKGESPMFDVHLDNWISQVYPTVADLLEDMSGYEIKRLVEELISAPRKPDHTLSPNGHCEWCGGVCSVVIETHALYVANDLAGANQ